MAKQTKKSPAKTKTASAKRKSVKTTVKSNLKNTSKLKKPSSPFDRLKKLNFIIAALYAVQAVAILALSEATHGLREVVLNFLAHDRLASQGAEQPVLAQGNHHLFDINLAYLLVALLVLGALMHLLLATRWQKRYESDLALGFNRLRWLGYGLTAGLAMVILALLLGIVSLSTLVLIFVMVLLMSGLWLMAEVYRPTVRLVGKLAYGKGMLAGLVVWGVILLQLWSSYAYGSAIATFMYWVVASMLLFSLGFWLITRMQLKKRGKWADYLYTERGYIWLGFAAHTALTWQIFSGLLRP